MLVFGMLEEARVFEHSLGEHTGTPQRITLFLEALTTTPPSRQADTNGMELENTDAALNAQ